MTLPGPANCEPSSLVFGRALRWGVLMGQVGRRIRRAGGSQAPTPQFWDPRWASSISPKSADPRYRAQVVPNRPTTARFVVWTQ